MLGDALAIDATDFAVTTELHAKLGKERYGDFCVVCGAAFASLWTMRRFIAAFARAALGDHLAPGGAARVDTHLRRVLFLDRVRTRREAAEHMEEIARDAPGALATTVKNHVHGYAQALKEVIGSGSSSSGSAEHR